MKRIPEKVFEISPRVVSIGCGEIYLYDKDEIADAQIGYRVYPDGRKIEDWLGDEYFVVGNDSTCGDPIFINVSEKDFPVYYMFHDDWDSVMKVADSLEQYEQILKALKGVDYTDSASYTKAGKAIEEINSKAYKLYWEDIISLAVEFYQDDEE